MKYSSFQAFAKRYINVQLSSKKRVRVTFGGDTAFAKPGHINIPALPAGTVMSAWIKSVFTGYVEHELGHILYTDFTEWAKFAMSGKVQQWLQNIFEDIRIENERIEEVPITKSDLDSLCHYVDKEVARPCDRTKMSTLDVALKLIYDYSYRKYRDVDTQTFDTKIEDETSLVEVKKVMDRRMPKLASTKDVQDLATEVYNLLRTMFEDKEIKPGDLGQAEADPKDQTDPKIVWIWLNDNMSLPDPHQGKMDLANSLIRFIVLSNSQLDGSKINPPPPPKSQQRSSWFDRSPRNGQILPPVSLEGDKIFAYPGENIAQYERDRDSIGAETAALKKMLNLWLRVKSKKRIVRGLEEGQLDTEALYQFALGGRDMMKDTVETMLVDTAIIMMLDLSSSMNDELVRQAAICLGEGLNGIKKIKLEIAGFTTNEQKFHGTPAQGRSQGINIFLFKGFDERYQDARGKIGAIRTTGCTPLPDAYGYAIERMMGRKELKRIVVLVTDGRPYYDKAGPHDDDAHMKSLRRKAKRLGITTASLDITRGRGITDEYVEQNVQCDSIQELPQAMMNMVKGVVE